ncbi:MAG: hypothetical protein ILP18_09655 [Treponema sp.]|nr:hypothetical protein [Treponema sp.]
MRFKKFISNILDGRNIFFMAFMLVSALVIFSCRTVSVSQIWKGYRVLYVPVSASEESVLSVLAQSGCHDVISAGAQRIPLSTKFFNSLLDSSSYLEDRLGYFRDRDGDYRLYYIPDSYEKESEQAVNRLVREQHLSAGLDAKERYPFMVPLVVLALYAFLGVVSFKRLHFALPALFPLFLSFSRPFYPVVCGCCFLIFAIFLAGSVWGRKWAVSSVFKNFYVDALLLLALLLLFASSPSCLALALLALAASACAILFLRELKIIKDRNSSFTYSLIFTARQIPIFYGRTARFLLCLLLPMFAFLLMFIFSAKFSRAVSVSGILMPSPVQVAGGRTSGTELPLDSAVLPNAEDYFKWAWGVISYPYLNLNVPHAPVQEGDKVVLPRYDENDRGVKRKDEVVLSYNNSFRRDMEKSISSLEYPAVEKLLKEQDRNVLVMYSATALGNSSSNGKKGDVFNLIVIVFSLCVPVVLCTIFYSFNRSRV